jgi:hypothetical protein
VHADADVQDTACRSLLVAPLGLGVVVITQVVPVQRSASVSGVPVPLVYEPTAMHAFAELHRTDCSELLSEPLGVTVVWTFHPGPLAYAGPCIDPSARADAIDKATAVARTFPSRRILGPPNWRLV